MIIQLAKYFGSKKLKPFLDNILLYINIRPPKLPTVPLEFSLISCPPPPPPPPQMNYLDPPLQSSFLVIAKLSLEGGRQSDVCSSFCFVRGHVFFSSQNIKK